MRRRGAARKNHYCKKEVIEKMLQMINRGNETIQRNGGLTRWSLFTEFAALRQQFDDVFNRVWSFSPISVTASSSIAIQPEVDVIETDDKVLLFMAVPGFAPENIDVQATKESITIKGVHEPLFSAQNARYVRQGWASCKAEFNMTYGLPVTIDPNAINASFHHGVLLVEALKSEEARPKSIKVAVSAA